MQAFVGAPLASNDGIQSRMTQKLEIGEYNTFHFPIFNCTHINNLFF